MDANARPLVVVAETIADSAIAALESTVDVDVAVGLPVEQLHARLADAAGLIVRSATQVDAEMIAAAPNLQVVGRAGVGVDNIDVPAATAAGVLVVNAPDANTISAAEHTMALLLAQARRVAEADASLRDGRWDRKHFQGVELHGKTLGILGLGRIGTLVAQRASSFGMRLIAFDPFVNDDRASRLGVELTSAEDVLARADFVTIHLPRNRDTEGLINTDSLAKAKSGIRIINVARGGIVDEQALADAITAGHVAGAAVDVFAVEPTTESPLFGLKEVVVTPHLGASTAEAQDKAGLSVANSVVAALAGELLSTAVNLQMGAGVPDETRPYIELAEKLGRIFSAFSFGLPPQLTVSARGRDIAESVKAVALGAQKGAFSVASGEPVSYVNAPVMAERYGMSVVEEAVADDVDYRSLVRLSGTVADHDRTVAGTVMAHRGPVLVEVDGYEIEFPISTHMVLIRNSDTPGVIGRVGTLLGDAGLNVSDMAVGRSSEGGAMMGISLDAGLDEDFVDALRNLDGVLAARYIRLD